MQGRELSPFEARASTRAEQSEGPRAQGAARRLVVGPHRCKSRFCPHCAMPLGLQLRERLRRVLRTFKSVMMLTLTVDPALFPEGPQAAFDFCRERRSVALLVQGLKRRGVLLSGRWASIVEWQQNGYPHWHLIVEADYVPFAALASEWGKNWDESRWGPRPAAGIGQRAVFGSVRFTKTFDAESSEYAANYITKYITKPPKAGYPAWVLDYAASGGRGRRIRRFSTARGFWGGEPSPRINEEATGETREWCTIRERVARCGITSVVFRVEDVVDTETGEVAEEARYLGRVHKTYPELLNALGESARVGGFRRHYCTPAQERVVWGLLYAPDRVESQHDLDQPRAP